MKRNKNSYNNKKLFQSNMKDKQLPLKIRQRTILAMSKKKTFISIKRV